MYAKEADAMAKSYFTILGITTNASMDEVRSAYRRLAKDFHPDHYSAGVEKRSCGDGSAGPVRCSQYTPGCIIQAQRRSRAVEKTNMK